MNSPDRIGQLVPLLEKFQFPYCDARHENLVRDAHGYAVRNGEGWKLTDQCPIRTRFLRPACNHCEGHGLDPLSEMAYEIAQVGRLTQELRSMAKQHSEDLRHKSILDEQIRNARTSKKNLVHPLSQDEADLAAAPFVKQHREIVDRMRTFTAALLQAAKMEANVV